MYVGRIVSIGKNKAGKLAAMYRVSARAFPNRKTKEIDGAIAIVPKEGHESDVYKNPFIAYNGLKIVNNCSVLGNGSHVDPIADKLASGMQIRDAIISVLFGMDYEHDALNTPRITAVIDIEEGLSFLGIIRKDALFVQHLSIKNGEAYYIATYEHNYPSRKFHDGSFDIGNAGEGCDYIVSKGVFSSLERPVLSVCALESDNGFSVAAKDVNTPVSGISKTPSRNN